jgi:hypothetical protein
MVRELTNQSRVERGGAISLLVTTYQNTPYLRLALESAVSQLSAGDEAIVFDNKKVPGIDLAGVRSPVPIVVAKPDHAVDMFECWNVALRQGTNRWLLWLHDDDLLRPGAVEVLRTIAASHSDAVLVWGPQHDFFGDGMPDWTKERVPSGSRTWSPEFALARYLYSHVHACSGTLIKRDALLAALPMTPDVGINADTWLFQRIARQGEVEVVDAPVAGYRCHGASWTSRARASEWRKSVQMRRVACSALLQSLDVRPGTLAEAAQLVRFEVLADTLRSLVRAGDWLAPVLASALSTSVPGLSDDPAWARAVRGVRFGRWIMDAEGLVRHGADRINTRLRARVGSTP